MYQYLQEFLPLYIFHCVNLVIPGASFMITLRHSILYSRPVGLATAVGMVASSLFHKTLAVFGFGMLVRQYPWLFTFLKAAGCLHMLYLSFVCLRNGYHHQKAKGELIYEKAQKDISLFAGFRIGFLINFLNPRASLSFIAVLATMVKPTTPLLIQEAYVICMMITSLVWYSLVVFLFSHEKLRSKFLRIRHWVEYASSALMLFWAITLWQL